MISANFMDVFQESKRDDRNTASKAALTQLLNDNLYFGCEVDEITSGTNVTRYSIKIAPKRISLILKATPSFNAFFDTNNCRVQQDGKYVWVEVPNKYRGIYGFRDSLSALQTISDHKDKLWIALGEGLDGKCVMYDLAAMPHLLIAGQTGSGKSVFLHNVILSLLIQYSREDMELVLIDTKKVELDFYRDAPQVREVVTKTERAEQRIRSLCDEMDNRYEIFANAQVRDITGYNQKAEVKMPRLVVIIEELADLIMTTDDQTLADITRLAVKARASGIHIIVATQRPDSAFLGGKLKNNFQCRVAFSMASGIDSRIILGKYGAERLSGHGDGLFRSSGGTNSTRFQSALITEGEIKNAVKLIKSKDR